MGKRKKKKNQDNYGPMRKILLPAPVPDDRPNWPQYERHDVMMSVTMEYAPENLEQDFLAVICPVAKRRIVVSFMGWTCSYNKLLAMDRKFQSSLPGGNVRSVQVIKSNDLCILDCLHYKADRTFFILDLMHWKQLPYYQSEAEFRFHWINQIENEMDLVTIHAENEYKFKAMPRIRCNQKDLYEALENAPFKVDGLLFFHKQGCYQSGTSCNVLWLPPGDIESVLGWKPPEKALLPKKKSDTASSTSASSKVSATSGATTSTPLGTAASSSTGTAASTETAANSSTETAANSSTETAASSSIETAASSSTGTAETAFEGLEKTACSVPAATISGWGECIAVDNPPAGGSESAAAGDATATAAS